MQVVVFKRDRGVVVLVRYTGYLALPARTDYGFSGLTDTSASSQACYLGYAL